MATPQIRGNPVLCSTLQLLTCPQSCAMKPIAQLFGNWLDAQKHPYKLPVLSEAMIWISI
jgi:hypothetical protein